MVELQMQCVKQSPAAAGGYLLPNRAAYIPSGMSVNCLNENLFVGEFFFFLKKLCTYFNK
jgi:hypothetical protein